MTRYLYRVLLPGTDQSEEYWLTPAERLSLIVSGASVVLDVNSWANPMIDGEA